MKKNVDYFATIVNSRGKKELPVQCHGNTQAYETLTSYIDF